MNPRLIFRRFAASAAVMIASLSSHPSAPATVTNAPPARADYQTYKIIVDRNIFNPKRSITGGSRPATPGLPPPRVESFALRGILSSEKGRFAFFDSSSSQFRKVVEPSQTIAGFKVAEVSTDSVTLESNGPPVTLTVGMEMRREDEGPWKPSEATPVSLSAAANSSSNSPSRSSAGEEDLIKRMMQRRAKE